MAAIFNDPSVTFDSLTTSFDGAVITPPQSATGPSFRLKQAVGGSALRGGDIVRGPGGLGVIIAADTLLVATATGVDAGASQSQGKLITLAAPGTGAGAGIDAILTVGNGKVISIPAPGTGAGSGLSPTFAEVLAVTNVALGSGSVLSASVGEILTATTGTGAGSGLQATVTGGIPTGPPSTVWEVRIYDLNASTPRLSFAPVADWSFGYVLNAPGAFEATVPLTNAQALESNFRAGQREIRVYRNTKLVWGGYLWSANANIRDYTVRLVGEGYYSRLRRRFVMGDLIYENPGLPQEQIAWNLIKHTQNQSGSPGSPYEHAVPPLGDLNISEGGNQYTTVRERDYCAAQHPNVADSIDELTAMDDGFDFQITPTPVVNTNKVFTTYSPRKQFNGGVVLDGSNTMTLDYDIDASDTVTRMSTVGSGDCNPPDDDRTSASITNFGLLQDIEEVQFSNLLDVQAHGKEQLRNRNTARWQATAEFDEKGGPAWGSFDIGDTVTVKANKGFANFTQPMRVLEMTCSFQKEFADCFTTLTLDSVAS